MKPVLAVFAKTPHPGKVKTRLAPALTPEEGAELYHCMLQDTIARMRTLGVETVIFYDGDEEFFRNFHPGLRLIRQHQAGLGERLEAAFRQLEDLGYRERVVIGSDAPDLPLSFIREAFDFLGTGKDVVFGPAEDGGYYLVGLSGGMADLFQDVPWSTSEVLAVSYQKAQHAEFAVELISTWYDIDSYEDLLRPGLYDPESGATLTRRFLLERGIEPLGAVACSCG
ncbi:hypothetical protein GMLC_21370 [Geomonas limicola]|uniref:Glycosyltransferase n=1 Tax=Geomonas limicola TaxID=2740186 RepID=A0A6V8N7M8_9BACT|nr:TIGR04282 family arsenosugar biosynthesis glycosyltransferase [Geomonas limicola]GFO68558.1 hypothetical protein GMLC_21370 [Geomonas limicola]